MSNGNTREVGRVLEKIRRDEDDGEELTFDPTTGELVVEQRGQVDQDRIPATKMAREGFFISNVESSNCPRSSVSHGSRSAFRICSRRATVR